MYDEEVLVEVCVPAVQLKIDFYASLYCKGVDLKKAIFHMYQEHPFFQYMDERELHIYHGDSKKALDDQQILFHYDIKNGTCLFIL
ncbi:MAG: hypothetical protein K2F55_04450 [Erysipelotrichaceae bacterium]|nr:hypothetical protein [Erysipelotrichaceae bacterium]